MRKISNILDTSNLNINNPCYNLLKKSICGVLKNEFPLHYIESFIGLSPKTYSIKLSDFQIRKLVSLTKDHFQSLYNWNVLTLVGKKYYDNEIYKEIKDKDNKDITYFYIEIDKNFDIYVYYYDVNLVSRPIENYNINKLLHSKSKVCKGLPYYFKSNMSHSDYYDTLIHGNQNNSYVNFSIITNVSGVTKRFMWPNNPWGLEM